MIEYYTRENFGGEKLANCELHIYSLKFSLPILTDIASYTENVFDIAMH